MRTVEHIARTAYQILSKQYLIHIGLYRLDPSIIKVLMIMLPLQGQNTAAVQNTHKVT